MLMAFPQPNAQRGIACHIDSIHFFTIIRMVLELTNRKILEDLQLKKQLLLKQGVQPTLNPSSLSAFSATNVSSSDGHSINSAQRAALQTANAQSMGFFITQVNVVQVNNVRLMIRFKDSSFGNLILPVLPRFDSVTKQT